MIRYITTSTGAKIRLEALERGKFRIRMTTRMRDVVGAKQTVTKRYILDNQHYTMDSNT